ncbi:10747_t:CDS:1, partial [Acaulospora colombiana]
GHEGNVTCFSISPDGTRIVSGDDYGMVRIWDATTGASLGVVLDGAEPIVHLAYSLNGSHVIIGTSLGHLSKWYGFTSEISNIKLQCNIEDGTNPATY